ncbi:MAG: radical SAM protein [Candidatus Gracilibacteria bacterium]
MFDKFIEKYGLYLLNIIFSDYMGTQFFPSKFFANDIVNESELFKIYNKSIQNSINNLYIHIPFCKTGCYYCHCFKYVGDQYKDDYLKYIDYLIKEIDYNYKLFGEKIKIDSIFIGGGTPNIIGINNLEKLFKKIEEKFNLSTVKQFNIDFSPYYLDENIINLCADYGINRCTLAIQSFDCDILNQNSRFNIKDFDYKTVIKYLQIKGIYVNVDLMIGIKGQTIESCIKDINKCIEYGVDNISLNYFIQSSNVTYILDDDKKNLIQKIKKYYNKNINNKYNKSFNFQEESYLKKNVNLIGIGNGAITHLYSNIITYNNMSLNDYYKGLDSGKILNINYKKLTKKDEAIKYIWFNLIYGINRIEFKEFFGDDIMIIFENEINYLLKKQIIEISNDSITPIVNNFKLYLNLTIFLLGYIDLKSKISFDKIKNLVNIKKFFLSNLEKIDEDY